MYDTASKGLKIMLLAGIANFIFGVLSVFGGSLDTIGGIGSIIAAFAMIFGIYLVGQDIDGVKKAPYVQAGVFVCQILGGISGIGILAGFVENILTVIVMYLICKYVGEAVYNYGAINTSVLGDYIWKGEVAALIASFVSIVFPLAFIVAFILPLVLAFAYPIFIFKSGQILADE